MNKNINILENTLRDGLYILDFLITPEEIFKYSKNMIDTNFDYIEIGHGLGIGAYKKIASGFSDQELYQKMAPLLTTNKIFSFFIPAISHIEDLRIPMEHGLYGIRIGMDALTIKKNYSVIETIKKMGFFVALNIMKSYTITPKELVDSVKGLEEIVDILYIVDSAGYMLPEEVKSYFVELKNICNFTDLGFHGHNNLGLATANALLAIEEGATFIDTTLGGIGRSGGNIATESFISILNRMSFINDEKNLLKIFELSKNFRKMIEKKGRFFSVTEEDILFGYSGFHSSHEEIVKQFTNKHGLDFNKFVTQISKENKTTIDKKILYKIKNKDKYEH